MFCRSRLRAANRRKPNSSFARAVGRYQGGRKQPLSKHAFGVDGSFSPPWKAGFVSKSDSTEAWIDSEEAKQTVKVTSKGK